MIQQHFASSLSATAPENYERFFVPAIGRPLAEALVRVAALNAGERVLDVGCGTGVVARLAAERVGSGGAVVGLDINPGMLAVARSGTPSEMGIEWHQGSAESMPLPDAAFDAVLCQMTLQFVPDRLQGLREMRRVLTSGGRLVLNVPGPAAPLFEILADAMGHYIGPQAAGFVRAVFALHEEAELESLLKDAGFRDVNARAETRQLSLPAPRDFLWEYVSSTPLAAIVEAADDDARSALEREVVAAWQQFVRDDGMRSRQRVVTATAHRQ
jgi:ubiquinone/menaquinone biosynthesis C-methylase UbiE